MITVKFDRSFMRKDIAKSKLKESKLSYKLSCYHVLRIKQSKVAHDSHEG